MSWDKIPDDNIIEKTKSALEKNGIKAVVVEKGADAKEQALKMIEKGATVMTATSTTAQQIGLDEAIDNSSEFVSLRKKITSLPESEQRTQARRINSAPDYVVGSVHAVTQDGEVIVASNSGSQIPPYAFSASKVIWIVGAQKIVKDIEEGMKRIKEYTLPLEDERMMKTYGMHSAIRKLLIVKSEIVPERIIMFIVKENLGF